MPTDYLLSARAFLPKALLQETKESETYCEYSSQYKKNNFMLNAGARLKNFYLSKLLGICCSLFEKEKKNLASTEIYQSLPIHLQLQRKPLHLVIYSSLLNLRSHSHEKFAIRDNEKNKTMAIFFFIFIHRTQTSRTKSKKLE